MNRIPLTKRIDEIINTTYMMEVDFQKYKKNLIKKLKKLISENYRRRKYHVKGYTCNKCKSTLKPGKICKC